MNKVQSPKSKVQSPSDLALIDGFEKIRAYLLQADPTLEAGVLARPREPSGWSRLSSSEYQEALLAVLLGIDRGTAAGRRVVRGHVAAIMSRTPPDTHGQVAEKSTYAARDDLFRSDKHEQWLRKNGAAVAKALDLFLPDQTSGSIALIAEIARAPNLREAVLLLRKRTRLFAGLRAFAFLEQIGYPLVVPDPRRQDLFQRLGWIGQTVAVREFPQEFFELGEQIVHLTGEPHSVVNAATGLFAGSRGLRPAGNRSLAVCATRPRCGECILKGQCSCFRYRGEPQPSSARTIKRLAYAEQPRTRFETLGPANLTEVELLGLIVRTGAEGKSALDLAREILERFGSVEALANAGLGELRQVKGVGRAKAIEIKAAVELGRRMTGKSVALGEAIRRSADVFDLYRNLLAHEQQESFYLVVLNTRNRIQSHFLISRGSLTGSFVHPREVMKMAIREAAASIIFVHNHPSGDPEPSEDDIDITGRLARAARLVGIRVLDHVIIGHENYFSFADHHLLEEG